MNPSFIETTAAWLLKEAEVTLDIDKGDVLLGGKYKNSPITVDEIGTDELGQPTVNGKKLLAFRIKKKMPEKTAAHVISTGASSAAEYLAGLRAAQAAPVIPAKLLAKARALKKPKVPAQALLEKLTGLRRSGRGYVGGD